MNHPNSAVRCKHCNLLNFASEPFCKRCKNPTSETNSVEANTINININIPANVQPRVNVLSNKGYANNKPPEQMPPFENNNQNEYLLQNQTGFQQWQQANSQNNAQNYPQQTYAQPMYPMMQMPSIFRRGSELVVHQYAGTMPDCCVKCNEPISNYSGGAYITQKFRWHNPLVYIALISPLIYVILSLCLSHRVRVEVPLCKNHLEARDSVGKTLLGGGIASIIAILFFSTLGYVGFAFLIFLASLIGITIGYEYFFKPLQISKIENDFIYLKNADNNFLNRLPFS